MYLSRCQQDWLVAESSGVCVHPINMKVHLLRKGAHFIDSQVDRYNMMMMDREWEFDWAIRAYHAIDLSASETGGRKTQVYMVDEDASGYQDDETEDVATVLVNLADFGINDSSGADDHISIWSRMISKYFCWT